MTKQSDEGVSEVIATILLVALVVILAAVIASIVFGVIELQPKSAYIPPEVKLVSANNTHVISLYSKGGDQAVLWPVKSGQYALAMYLDTPSGSYRAVPDTGVTSFDPGQTLFLYNNGSTTSPTLRLTNNLTGKTILPLPSGQVNFRIVDENAQLLVYKQGFTIGSAGTVTVSPTISPTPTCVVGTAWVIRNRNSISFQYLLKVEPSGEIISSGTIDPKQVIHLWYPKSQPYSANLSWYSPTTGSMTVYNDIETCYFDRYNTIFPGQGVAQPPQLIAGEI